MTKIFGTEYKINSKQFIDLRSDVVTKQSSKMRDAMFLANVGNDGWGEDPTVNELQNKFASLVGKERALFVPSGSMGNLIAVMSQTQKGDEIIADINSHIFQYSVAGIALCAGVQIHAINPENDFITIDDVKIHKRQTSFQYPETSMVCFENPHNINGGKIHDPYEFSKVTSFCHEQGLKVHLDGSRLFNAAVAKKCSVTEWTNHVDTVMCCMSKSLGAPMGSLLAGKNDVIEKAIHYRRMLGGHMRQVGYIAAAGIYALDNNIKRLEEDHRKATKFAEGIKDLPNIKIITPETNMVFFSLPVKAAKFIELLSVKDVLVSQYSQGYIRTVFHMDISHEDVMYAINAVRECYDNCKK